jgi:hypothetical protein
MGEWRILRGRIERWAAHYAGPPFHALVCDPPYELGFMGRDWDRSGVSFRPETWAALAEHLYPGAFGMAFASSRGWHRLAVAIEDAGLIIHPSIFGWSFGSGFPKATRIDTQVDAAAGAEREVVGSRVRLGGKKSYSTHGDSIFAGDETGTITVPATPLARAWAGHRYGLQSLKPALEPIIVFQKPYEGKPVESIVETGAGALWIDGGRIATQSGETNTRGNKDGVPESTKSGYEGGWGNPGRGWNGQCGRWPGNLALVHHPDCVRVGTNDAWDCHPDCPVRSLGEQSGVSRSSGGLTPGVGAADGGVYNGGYGARLCENAGGLGDTGTAARFFFQADWALERAEPVLYCAKASRAERDAGLAVRNPHPTVKPLALCKWLATLLLPPAEYAPRRVLAPFAGSGSEMIGALLAGWEWVLGVEMLAENARLAEARLAWWADKARWGQTEPATLLSEYEPDNGHRQLEIWLA